MMPRHILSYTAEELAWQDDANCQGSDPTLFFPQRGESARPAKQICEGCQVRPECLTFALEIGEWSGIWGGKSPRERKRIRRIPTPRREIA